MPRPTTDRVIHDYTAKILPATMIFTLVIFTVVVLVYSIGEKAAVPRDAAVAFAGIVFGFSGLWLLGHLVMYCRGAQAVSPPPLALPLPLTGIATGVGATTMAVPQVPQAAVDVVVPPTVHLHQQQQQQHQQVYKPQNNQYRDYQPPQGFPPQLQLHSQPQDQSHQQVLPPQQEHQHRQQREDDARAQAEQREQQLRERQQRKQQQHKPQEREQQQHRGQQREQQAEAEAPVQSGRGEQRNHESYQRLTDHEPYVKEPPYPESPPGAHQGGSQEEPKELAQQQKDQRGQQQVELEQQQPQQGREIAGPLENVWKKRPGIPVNQPAPVTVSGPVHQRQQPKGPRTMTGKPPEPPERVSSLQKSLPGTSSRRHRSSSLSSSRVNRPGQLLRGASNLPRPVRSSRSGDSSETIGERGRPRSDRSRPDQNQDIEPEPRSASIRSTSLDSATRASLKVNTAPESCESSSWTDSDQPAPLNIAKESPTDLGRPIEEPRVVSGHASLSSRRSDQLESDPRSRGTQGKTVAKNRPPTIREVPPTPPNEFAAPVQPAHSEVRDRSVPFSVPSSSSSSPSFPPSRTPPARRPPALNFDDMNIIQTREPTVCEDIRQSISDLGKSIRRSFTNSRARNSGSCGKPRSLMTDFQTNVVFMPDYNFMATELLNPASHEDGSFPFLAQCEGDEEKVASGEELEDRGDVVMVCSSDDTGQWLIKLVELAESSNEAESDVVE